MSKAKKINPEHRKAEQMRDGFHKYIQRLNPEYQLEDMRNRAQQILDAKERMPPVCVVEADIVLKTADALEKCLANDSRDKRDVAMTAMLLTLAYARMLEQRVVGAQFASYLWRGVWYHNMTEQDKRLLAKLAQSDKVPVDDLIPKVAGSKSALRKHRATLNAKLRDTGSAYKIATISKGQYVIVKPIT